MKNTDVKFLKFFVYLLGFVLIFATVFLTYAVYKRNFAEIVTTNDLKSKCSPVNLEIPGRVQDVMVQGDTIQVISRDENHTLTVHVHDYCNGNEINTITVKEKLPERPAYKHEEQIDPNEKDVLS